MALDFELMQRAARASTALPGLAQLRLDESIKQFGGPLHDQLDLTKEASHLHRFRNNFRRWSSVQFPLPIFPLVAPDVLVRGGGLRVPGRADGVGGRGVSGLRWGARRGGAGRGGLGGVALPHDSMCAAGCRAPACLLSAPLPVSPTAIGVRSHDRGGKCPHALAAPRLAVGGGWKLTPPRWARAAAGSAGGDV